MVGKPSPETIVDLLSNRDTSANPSGGRAARLLVADDNSNIQRMVALALKDHGIDVIAVGNGEAAVRSISQLAPDLILADVFMPVRSGYEVCDYVKKDSRYSHIPVVLLLGAFDPLDENEAKRVGADGVLKKPFVPPDPMIALVKSLLEKSAPERLAAVTAPVPVPVGVGAGGAGPEPLTATVQIPSRIARAVIEAVPQEEESAEIDYPPMGRDAFDTAPPVTAPVEMQSAAPAAVEDAEVMTHQRDAALGEPAFWHPAEAEAATDETHTDEIATETAFEPVEPKPGYFDPPTEEAAPASESVAPIIGAHSETVAEMEHSAPDQPAAEIAPWSATEEHTAVETNPEPWSAPAESSELIVPAPEAAAPEVTTSENDSSVPAPAAVDSDREPSYAEASGGESDWKNAPAASIVELSASGESAFAPSSAVWSEPEATPAPSEFAAAPTPTEESSVAEPVAESAPVAHAEQPAQELADTQKILPEVLAVATRSAQDSYSPEPPADEIPEAVAGAAAVDEPKAAEPNMDELVNAVVSRVIAKLQPQIAEMINEEILRPVVSALVRNEIKNP
jgi:CheY-like chemotaxis protein